MIARSCSSRALSRPTHTRAQTRSYTHCTHTHPHPETGVSITSLPPTRSLPLLLPAPSLIPLSASVPHSKTTNADLSLLFWRWLCINNLLFQLFICNEWRAFAMSADVFLFVVNRGINALAPGVRLTVCRVWGGLEEDCKETRR